MGLIDSLQDSFEQFLVHHRFRHAAWSALRYVIAAWRTAAGSSGTVPPEPRPRFQTKPPFTHR